MLLEYSCSNFRSISEKVTLSMIASSDDTYESELREFDKLRINRMASIYGANGSGKSSLIISMGYLQALVINSMNHQPGDKINRFPHKLNPNDLPTSLSCQFVKNGIRYAYGVSVTEEMVTEEYLYFFPNGRQAKIFDRKGNEIIINEIYKKDCEAALTVHKDNRLFLSCAANFTSIKEFETVFLFFKEDIIIYPNEPNNWLNYSVDVLSKNKVLKQDFINFMNSIGTGLSNVRTNYEKKRFDVKELPEDMPDFLKGLFTSQDANIIEAKLDYDRFILDLQEESSGIKKLFEIICPLIDIIDKDRVLIWDELETSLHPCIVLDILNYFQKGKLDSNSQLIFTTHDINLLDLKRFRRDQIWFTELKALDRSTELYSLSELRNVRKDENIRKGYISGKYGAIPCLNGELAEVFNAR